MFVLGNSEHLLLEFSKLLKSYALNRVVTDRYALLWPVEQFAHFGISAEQNAETKGLLYVAMLPYLNSARVELLDEPRGIHQICNLERRTVHGGRDAVDHPANGFDDVSNAIAGAISVCAKGGSKYRYDVSMNWVSGPTEDAEKAFAEARMERHIRMYGARRW